MPKNISVIYNVYYIQLNEAIGKIQNILFQRDGTKGAK